MVKIVRYKLKLLWLDSFFEFVAVKFYAKQAVRWINRRVLNMHTVEA